MLDIDPVQGLKRLKSHIFFKRNSSWQDSQVGEEGTASHASHGKGFDRDLRDRVLPSWGDGELRD